MKTTLIDKKENPYYEKYAWVRYVYQRIAKNKNLIICITGPTGSGKSYAGLSIAHMLNGENFSSKNIIFEPSDFMDRLNSGELKSGSVILWEEAGIKLNNRNWADIANKMINYVMQTFRHRNYILIFTVPYDDFVDSATRKLFHANFEMVKIDQTNKTGIIKPLMLQYNNKLKKMYYHYLKVTKSGYGRTSIKRWAVPKPPKDLLQTYENLKHNFTANLNKDISHTLKRIDHEKKGGLRPLTEKQQQILDCWKRGVLRGVDIEKETGIDNSEISRNKKWMRNKGYFLEDYENIAKKNTALI